MKYLKVFQEMVERGLFILDEMAREVKVRGLNDIEIECIDCEEWFVFAAGEQQYFIDRGMPFPKRCEKCREARRTNVHGETPRRFTRATDEEIY